MMDNKVFKYGTELFHYGTPRHSGRYPWGSGKEPYQHGGPDILGRFNEIKKKSPNLSDKDICDRLNITTSELRNYRTIAKDDAVIYQKEQWTRLREKGMSDTEIAKRYGVTSTTVKNRIEKPLSDRIVKIQEGAEIVKKAIAEKGYIDMGYGALQRIGINDSQQLKIIDRLKKEGYVQENVLIEQAATGHHTTVRVLAAPGTTKRDFLENKHNIRLVDAYKENDGRTIRNLEPPVSVDSKRLKVRYAEDGGTDKDGVIEIRRGVKDLSLGNANYAQVRIAVDGTHYLKGMAVYGDNMPKGVDIVFNTNKTKDTPALGPKGNSVLKLMERTSSGDIDMENPFSATIKPSEKLVKAQRYYEDENGKKKLSPINVVNEEGDWSNWSKTLSSQFLSKQPYDLVKRQLKYTMDDAVAEFKEIQSINNPVVKKHLLEKYADQCDYNAVHLKAAALPRQASHVILPLTNISEKEIYAPNYKNGEQVVLIRYPHGGKFEIPQLKVNNNIPSGKKMMKNAPDAVGIHPNVASVLSGADFDGDTVLVIPTNRRVHIETQPPLKELAGFEPKEVYKGTPTSKKMTNTQTQMGVISNLITDMTLIGPSDSDIARAVKHSMVVIDAEKHGLDYQRSAKENGIAELKRKYRGSASKGASTLISQAKAQYKVPERSKYFKINPETGEKVWDYTNKVYRKYVDPKTGKKIDPERYTSGKYAGKIKYNSDGKPVYPEGGVWVDGDLKMIKSTRMAETKDARKLLSDNPNRTELAYAKYANQWKALGNEARKESLKTPSIKVNTSAKKAYAKEIESINRKLVEVDKQKPLERQAQMIQESNVKAMIRDDPTILADSDKLKKIKYQCLEAARYRVGKKKTTPTITDREWEAIQAGAITNEKARKFLNAVGTDAVRQRATPRPERGLSDSQASRVKAMLSSGLYTQQEIAEKVGCSVATVRKYM